MGNPPTLSSSTTSRRSRWQEYLVVLAVVVGLALTAWFSYRLYQSVVTLRHTRLRLGVTDTNLIQDWMSIPYIARSYRVPETVIWQGLGISERGNRIKNLGLLDREYAHGQPGVIANRVKAIVSAYLAQHPPTPTPAVSS
jgi:hypothetical protein